jgi:hypothetical protein
MQPVKAAKPPHRLVTRITGVQVIAGIVHRQELRGRGIARDLVEIDHPLCPLVRIHWLSA